MVFKEQGYPEKSTSQPLSKTTTKLHKRQLGTQRNCRIQENLKTGQQLTLPVRTALPHLLDTRKKANGGAFPL
ncbi:hypothetical protein AVEN_201420-1, partial [Araneus ventricosus]